MKSLHLIMSLSVVIPLLSFYQSRSSSFFSLVSLINTSPLLHLLHSVLLCSLIYSLSQSFILFFYKDIRSQEVSIINDNIYLFLTDILLVLTLFNRDINYRNLIFFFLILCFRTIQWINTLRSDNIYSNSLVSLMSFLLAYYFLDKIDLHFLFSFEFVTIFISSIKNLFYIKIQDRDNKSVYKFILEIGYLVCLVIVYCIFFLFLSFKYKIPLNLFRPGINVLEKLVMKVRMFLRYLKICRMIDEISEREEEGECIICQDEKPSKKLRCGHVFHGECVKQWCERQHFCPICKVDLTSDINYEIVDDDITDDIVEDDIVEILEE
ncbi:E3 ubiquitin-protein ligase [Vairimorpha necatrix]|uniref:E3 ubiquitin-protein ligase n=1 Tax=Vairimorpha necatrix TaxID=6039 RepID=A0AAX4JGT1_9MICR